MKIAIRGRVIKVKGNEGMRAQYVRLYSSFTDDRLDELERESNAQAEADELRYASAKDEQLNESWADQIEDEGIGDQ